MNSEYQTPPPPSRPSFIRGMLYVFILFDSRPTALFIVMAIFLLRVILIHFIYTYKKKGHPQKVYHWLVMLMGFALTGWRASRFAAPLNLRRFPYFSVYHIMSNQNRSLGTLMTCSRLRWSVYISAST